MKRTVFSICLLVMTMASSAFTQNHGAYLSKNQLPDGIKYLPAPPDTTSIFFVNDWARYSEGLAVRQTPRGQQAKADADCSAAYIASYYAPALGMEIDKQKTPELFNIIARTADTSGKSTDTAKTYYKRRRPFMVFNQTSMTPDHEPGLRLNGSYPSGHAAIAWSVALVLTEIAPEAQDIILKLGYEYGQSRTIVGVHFQSDVDAGRVTASAAVARLHADDAFLADLKKAKAEYAALKGKK